MEVLIFLLGHLSVHGDIDQFSGNVIDRLYAVQEAQRQTFQRIMLYLLFILPKCQVDADRTDIVAVILAKIRGVILLCHDQNFFRIGFDLVQLDTGKPASFNPKL